MTLDKKPIEVPNEFKTQADNMFKELNSLIEEVTSKVNSISSSLSDLESKLTVSLSNASSNNKNI